MKKPTPLMRAVALMLLIVIGLMGNVAFTALPTPDYSSTGLSTGAHLTDVQMVEIRFVPTNWWGLR